MKPFFATFSIALPAGLAASLALTACEPTKKNTAVQNEAQPQTVQAERTGSPPGQLKKLEISTPVQRDNVHAKLAAFTGDFTIDAWTNNKPANRFWTNIRVSGRDLSLPVKFDNAQQWVHNCLSSPKCANQSFQWLGYEVANDHGVPIDDSYKAEVTAAYDGLIQSLHSPLTTVQRNDVSLQNFVQVGTNTVHYKVTPQGPTWSVLIQLYTMDSAGVPTIIQETYLDDKSGGLAPVITLNVTK